MADQDVQLPNPQSGSSPSPPNSGANSPAAAAAAADDQTPANKDSPPAPAEQLSAAEGAALESGQAPVQMTLNISNFRKPGEKTFTQRSRLFVANLPLDMPEEEFINLFAKYGNTAEVFINRERGFGFIRLPREDIHDNEVLSNSDLYCFVRKKATATTTLVYIVNDVYFGHSCEFPGLNILIAALCHWLTEHHPGLRLAKRDLTVYESRTLAEIAKAELDGTVLNNRQIRIRFAAHGAALTVRNLLPVVTNELLEQAFSQFGPVERCIVVTDDRGRPTGRGVVEFASKAAARKALESCTEGALLLTATPCPAIVEPTEHFDDEEGLPENMLSITPKYLKERAQTPHFAQPGTFEFEYSSRWKALDELVKQQRDQVDKSIKEAKEKLEAELESAKHEHQLMLMRHDLMRRQEELRRLEELRNQELHRRKQIELRHEEERRRREEEMMRTHREQEELRRQADTFKPAYQDNREQEMRAADLGPRGAVNMADGLNQAPAGPGANQGQMMSMGGRGNAAIPEGTANMNPLLMAENGNMRGDRYPLSGLLAGRAEVESPKQQQQQQPQQQPQQPPTQGPPGGPSAMYGSGSPVDGVFDGPNSKRPRY